ncbi:hypothetical protein CDD82_4893 [Ophiocordyceps australis]|uniref:Uncharacterized protein n=1 Tax=Ophiocordyceps australis TaxID=1399860 RepID=A0A2C5YY89_9HYPO|nr:hypothetical protein CDD82_4893 [Ophiocordyceps australis]
MTYTDKSDFVHTETVRVGVNSKEEPSMTGNISLPTETANVSGKSSSDYTASPVPQKSWIAAIVVPIVLILAISLFISIFCLVRRRKRVKAAMDLDSEYFKPQLHSDCVPRREPEELDVSMPQRTALVEMEANEVPAHEAEV